MKTQIEKRIAIERRIVSRIVKDAFKLNYTISVYDGEEYCLKHSTSYAAVMNSIQSTDSDMLKIRSNDKTIIGNIFLVYGNDGYDVICDHSDNELTNELLQGANTLAESIELKS